MKYNVIDWSNGDTENVVASFELAGEITGFSYDGGRLDIEGVPDTIYVETNQFSVRRVKD